jgi:hypothetical protein
LAVHAYLALNKGEATSLGRAVSLARGRFDLDFGHVAGEAVPGGWRLSFYTSGKAAKAGGKGPGAVVLVANLGGVNVIKKES